MLASYIRENGNYEPRILDFELESYNSPVEIARRIVNEGADYVGFSTLTPRFPTIQKTCSEIKNLNPNIKTILGGPHITGRPHDCRYAGIDFAILGEGEQAFLELLDALSEKRDYTKVSNLAYRVNGGVAINPKKAFIANLDSLPLPAWDLLKMKEYRDPTFFEQEAHAGVFTTRGCPQDCIFCASKVTWERKLRFRSVDEVVREFKELSEKYGVKNLYFYDDHFATRPKRTLDLCNRMITEGLGMRYVVQVRADSINPELAKALKDSGCVSAALGIESGNEEMLKRIRKNETKEEMRLAVKVLKDAGVPITTTYIIGLPGDTHESIRETLNFARELDTQQMKFMLLTPVPGTDVHKMAVERGLLDPENFSQMEKTNFYDTTAVNLSSVSVEDLLRYQDEAYQTLDRGR
jgi:radical SAM superfamily enzyme YgiQ (UPF0313 family)